MEYLFETERLKARRFLPEDAPRLFEIHAEDEVRKWIPNESYADPEEARDAIDFFAGCVDHNRLPYVLAVESKQTGELIGDAGINEVEGQAGEVEVGYVICAAYSGKGYATELLRVMTGFAASKFGSKVLYGRVMRGNGASVKVLENAGFSFVREETGAPDDLLGAGMLVYRKECGLSD